MGKRVRAYLHLGFLDLSLVFYWYYTKLTGITEMTHTYINAYFINTSLSVTYNILLLLLLL